MDCPTTNTANVRGREQWGQAVREWDDDPEDIARQGMRYSNGEYGACARKGSRKMKQRRVSEFEREAGGIDLPMINGKAHREYHDRGDEYGVRGKAGADRA